MDGVGQAASERTDALHLIYAPLVRNSDYWATSAQLMAILALAIVVEGRTLTSRWNVQTPTAIKIIHITTLASPLVVFAFAIPLCLDVLKGDEPSAWADELIETAITLALVVLVLNPAIDFALRTFSRQISRVVTRSFFASYRLRLAVVKVRMLTVGVPGMRRIHRAERKLRAELSEMREIRAQLMMTEPPPHLIAERNEAVARLDAARKLTVGQLVDLGRMRQGYRDLKADYEEARAYVKSVVPGEVIDDLSKELEEQILAYGLWVPGNDRDRSPTESDDDTSNEASSSQQSRTESHQAPST